MENLSGETSFGNFKTNSPVVNLAIGIAVMAVGVGGGIGLGLGLVFLGAGLFSAAKNNPKPFLEGAATGVKKLL